MSGCPRRPTAARGRPGARPLDPAGACRSRSAPGPLADRDRLGDALVPHGGAAWLATLIALLSGLGVNERAVRTGVFRIARDGWQAEAVNRRSRYSADRRRRGPLRARSSTASA